MSMDNEIAIRNLNDTLEIHSSNSNLLKKEENIKLKKRHLKADLDLYHSNRISILVGLGCSIALTTLSAFNLGSDSTDMAMATIMAAPVGGFFSTMGLSVLGFRGADSVRLKRSQNSSNPQKRAYYTNRVLDFMLVEKAQSSVMLNNPYTLAYALWFHEKGANVRWRKKHREYRKLFSKTYFSHFKDDSNYGLYLNMAQDMIDGLLDKEMIPSSAQSDSQKVLFEKYSHIINLRVPLSERKLSFRDQLYMNNTARMMKSKKESEDMQTYTQKLILERKKSANEHSHNNPTPEQSLQNLTSGIVFQESGALDCTEDLGILEDIEREWFETQGDIVKILKYPMFADMKEPLVRDFHTQLSIAKSLSKKSLNHNFIVAVSNLKTMWTSLMSEAHRIELTKFGKEERKKIAMATNLMGIALNVASTPSERQSAYKKALEQLKGLLTIPDRAVNAIEQAVSKPELVSR